MASPKLHPAPPANFDTIDLPIVRRFRQWFRVHGCHQDPIFFGTTHDWRYDDPEGEFGVLYLASDFEGAFVEGCIHDDVLGETIPILSESHLRGRCLSKIRFAGSLRLVDLTGSGVARIRADARLCSGDYEIAQRWSRALWGHPQQPDGILYLSRHNPSLVCAAIYDRAPFSTFKAQGSFLGPRLINDTARLLDKYGVGLS